MVEKKDPIEAALDGAKKRYILRLKAEKHAIDVGKEVSDAIAALQATFDAVVQEETNKRNTANALLNDAEDELVKYQSEQEEALGISLNLFPPPSGGMVRV